MKMFLDRNCGIKAMDTVKAACGKEDKNYICNRKKGHQGEHHAHAGGKDCCHVWNLK